MSLMVLAFLVSFALVARFAFPAHKAEQSPATFYPYSNEVQ